MDEPLVLRGRHGGPAEAEDAGGVPWPGARQA